MIIFVRHGQTDFNIQHKICGAGIDATLNETGRKQAEQVALELKDVSLDAIFCSPMIRAFQTMREIAKFHKNTPIFFDERIVERHWNEWEGASDSLAKVGENCTIGRKIEPEFILHPIEPLDEMIARVQEFWVFVRQNWQNKNILVVAHDGVGRISRMLFEGNVQDGDLMKMDLENAHPYILEK